MKTSWFLFPECSMFGDTFVLGLLVSSKRWWRSGGPLAYSWWEMPLYNARQQIPLLFIALRWSHPTVVKYTWQPDGKISIAHRDIFWILLKVYPGVPQGKCCWRGLRPLPLKKWGFPSDPARPEYCQRFSRFCWATNEGLRFGITTNKITLSC